MSNRQRKRFDGSVDWVNVACVVLMLVAFVVYSALSVGLIHIPAWRR